jgi:DNA mismatch endonuclease, patch repair protein
MVKSRRRTSRDPLSRLQRSKRMSLVRSHGNLSTELFVERALRAAKVSGWRKHPENIPGRPDFYFKRARLAVFIDGCFWHGCRHCARRLPFSRRRFWNAKISANRARDRRVRRLLREAGYSMMRVWEHQLQSPAWLKRIRRRLHDQQSPEKLTI